MEYIRVSTESDEYVSLRQEALGLFAQSRQILYITTAFVIVGVGWYAALASPPAIPLWIFTLFLLTVLDVSGVTYVVNTNQAYRIGGYLAVFWESYDPSVRLSWHRMNRLGPAGGFLPNAATFVYTVDVLIVLTFLMIGVNARLARPSEPALPIFLYGVGHLIAAMRLGAYLRRRRDEFELAWREIKESSNRQQAIHSWYETIPSRVVLP